MSRNIQEILAGIRTSLTASTPQGVGQTTINYKCAKCEDTESIPYTENIDGIDYVFAKPCECTAAKRYMRLYERSGVGKLFSDLTFDKFYTTKKPRIIQAAKEICQKYVKDYNGNYGLMLQGQSGSGKTHLCTAVCGELLKKNIGVMYMPYVEVMTNLKRIKIGCKDSIDEQNYTREIGKYKNAPVLYIDDLFKGKEKSQPTESDITIMFEIINHRYINKLPILVSTECDNDKLLDFDEAVGGRIIEMCRGYVVRFPGEKTLNHRLYGG